MEATPELGTRVTVQGNPFGEVVGISTHYRDRLGKERPWREPMIAVQLGGFLTVTVPLSFITAEED